MEPPEASPGDPHGAGLTVLPNERRSLVSMSPKLRTVVTVLVVVSGCSDREPTGLEPTSPATAPAASVQDSTPTQSPRDRKDTPWQR